MKKASGALAGQLKGADKEKVEADKKNQATKSPAGRVAKFVEDDSKVLCQLEQYLLFFSYLYSSFKDSERKIPIFWGLLYILILRFAS